MDLPCCFIVDGVQIVPDDFLIRICKNQARIAMPR